MNDQQRWSTDIGQYQITRERHAGSLEQESEDVAALAWCGFSAWQSAIALLLPLLRVEKALQAAVDYLFGDLDPRPETLVLPLWTNEHRACCMGAALKRLEQRSFSHVSQYVLREPLELSARIANLHVDFAEFEERFERRERHRLEQAPCRRLLPRRRKCRSKRFWQIPFDFETGEPLPDAR